MASRARGNARTGYLLVRVLFRGREALHAFMAREHSACWGRMWAGRGPQVAGAEKRRPVKFQRRRV